MKEHKKLYKSGKKWVVATLFTVAAGLTLSATNVHADSVNSAKSSVIQTPVVSSNTDSTNSVSQAQQNLDQKTAALSSAQAQAASLQNELTDAQNQEKAAEANLDATNKQNADALASAQNAVSDIKSASIASEQAAYDKK